MNHPLRKVVVPAAGLGTRFLPATKAIPKEMLPIVDTPTIQLIVEEALAAGAVEVVVVNGRGKTAIEDHFDRSYELEDQLQRKGKKELFELVRRISDSVRLVSVRQKEPLGLGHAVLAARHAVGPEWFGVLLGDGRATDGGHIEVDRIVEKPPRDRAPSNLAVIGRYVLPPDVFDILARLPAGAGGEIQLTDALAVLAQQKRLLGVRFQGVRHDAGDRLGYLQANVAYALKRPDLRDPLLQWLREVVK